MMRVRLHRLQPGEYAVGPWRVIHWWADTPGWTILKISETKHGLHADIIETHPRLRDCRHYIERQPR